MNLIKTYTSNFVINTLPNDWLGNAIHRDGTHEPHINCFLHRNATEYSVLIDAGSNYGWHSLFNSFRCATVYSFEPQTHIYQIQRDTIAENNITNIRLFNCGLGARNETKQMAVIEYNHPSLNIGDLNIGEGGQVVDIKTIDSLNLPRVDFVKIDVQGYEKFVIEGARETVARCKPIIIVEVEDHQLRKFQYGTQDLFAVLRDLGYHLYLLDFHYPADILCVHKDNLELFISANLEFIRPLSEDNNLNHCVLHGVTEKVVYA